MFLLLAAWHEVWSYEHFQSRKLSAKENYWTFCAQISQTSCNRFNNTHMEPYLSHYIHHFIIPPEMNYNMRNFLLWYLNFMLRHGAVKVEPFFSFRSALPALSAALIHASDTKPSRVRSQPSSGCCASKFICKNHCVTRQRARTLWGKGLYWCSVRALIPHFNTITCASR